MAKASENIFPYVRFSEESSLPTPATDEYLIGVKDDGSLYLKNDAGSETDLTGAGGGGSFVGAKASLSTTQAVADSTDVPVAWNTENYDVGGFIDVGGANPSRFTIPSGEGGKYGVSGHITYAAGTQGLTFQVQVFVNSTNVAHKLNRFPTNSAEAIDIYTVLDLSVGDIVEIVARQATGSSRNIGTLGVVGNFATVTKLG